MKKHHAQSLRSIVSIAAAVLLLGAVLPFEAAACAHHPEHSDSCGYSPGDSGVACGHVCGLECVQEMIACTHADHADCGYQLGEDGAELSPCSHSCVPETGCVTEIPSCQHSCDDICGYQPAIPASSCQYDCQECTPPQEEPPEAVGFSLEDGGEPEAQTGVSPELAAVSLTDFGGTTWYATLEEALAQAANVFFPTIALETDLEAAVISWTSEMPLILDLKGRSITGRLEITGIEDSTVQVQNSAATGSIGSVLVSGGELILIGRMENETLLAAKVEENVQVTGDGVLSLDGGTIGGRIQLKGTKPIQVLSTANSYTLEAPMGVFAVPGTGVTLSESQFLPVTGDIRRNEDGSLSLYCEHSITHSKTEAAIDALCSKCGSTGQIRLILPDFSYTGQPIAFDYEASGLLADAFVTLSYDGGSSTAPSSLGKHTVTMNALLLGLDVTVEYEIHRVDIARASISYQEACDFTGSSHKPEVEVTWNGQLLLPEVDYTLTYGENIHAGNGTITLTGIGNYQGTVTRTFTIRPKSIADMEIALKPQTLTYTGQPQTQQVEAGDATVTITGNTATDAGTHTLTVTGTGDYTGTVQLEYTIAQAPAAAEIQAQQTIPMGTSAFAPPVFRDLSGENLPGTLVYTWDGYEYHIDAIRQNLAGLPSGGTAQIGYRFRPDNANYSSAQGTITIQAVALTFTVNGEAADSSNAVALRPGAVAGDENPLDLKAITATAGEAADSTPGHFSIRYTHQEDTVVQEVKYLRCFYEVLYCGTLDGNSFTDVPVCSGSALVPKPKARFETAPEALTPVYNGQPQALVTAGSTREGTPVFQLDGGAFEEALPTAVNALTEHRITFQIRGDQDHNDSDAAVLTTAIRQAEPDVTLPQPTAIFGQTLADVSLPAGFAWEMAADTDVGDAGSRSFPVSYTPEDRVNYKTLTNQDITLTISPREVTPEITLSEEYLPYTGADRRPSVTLKDPDTGEVIPSAEYEILYENNVGPGTATVTVRSRTGGNYSIREASASFVIFQYKVVLTTLSGSLPEDLKDTSYDSFAEIRTALSQKITGEGCVYYQLKLRVTEDGTTWQLTTDEKYFPARGVQAVLTYPRDTGSKTHDFTAALMYTVDSQRLQKEAGTILTADVTENDTGLRLTALDYAVICLSWEKNDADYLIELKKTGSGTIAASDGIAKWGDTVTITAAPSRSTYALKQVTAKTDDGQTVKLTALGGGRFTFSMPADDVTVTAEFVKKTSSSGNPNTGDPIAVWYGMLAGSAALLSCLTVKQKRRK